MACSIKEAISAWPPARDEAVDVATQPHEGCGRLVRSVLHQRHGIFGQTRLHCALAQQADDGRVGGDGGTRASQERCVPGLEAQPGRVARDVRPVLVNDPDHAEGNPHPRDPEAVGPHPAFRDLADGVAQPRHLAQPGRHAPDPVLGQTQPVPGRLDHAGRLGPLQITPIGLHERRPFPFEEVCGQPKGVVPDRARRPRHHPGGRTDAARELLQRGRGHRFRLQGPGHRDERRPGSGAPSTPRPVPRAPGPGPWRRPVRQARRSPLRRQGGRHRSPQ